MIYLSRKTLGWITVVLAIALLTQTGYVISAHALARYFNCITRVANDNGTVTIDNVEGCYFKVFQGARDADADGNRIILPHR